jgi:hypothetical protein
MFKTFVITLFFFVEVSLYAQDITPEERANQRMLLKNIALCQCIYQAFPALDSFQSLDGSDSAFMKASRYNPSAYDSTKAMAKIYALRRYDDLGYEYTDCEEGTFEFAKCLDFYESSALDSLVRRLDKEINLGILVGNIPENELRDGQPPQDTAESVSSAPVRSNEVSRESPPAWILSERARMKKSAFCSCVWRVYRKEYDSAWENEHTVSGYFQMSGYSLNFHQYFSGYIRAYAERTHATDGSPYRGPNGERLGIMKCLDFYYSAALDSYISEEDRWIDTAEAKETYFELLNRKPWKRSADSVKINDK